MWTMRDSQQAKSNTVEKNEEPRAEKIELIQALNEEVSSQLFIPLPVQGKFRNAGREIWGEKAVLRNPPRGFVGFS